MLKTAIIIPCYNEARRLPVDPFQAILQTVPWVDFFFVDDGSEDETRAVLQGLCASGTGRMRCLTFDVNRGKAEAVRQGMLSAMAGGYDLVGYWDADLATPLDAVPRFAVLFEDPRTQVVLGSRVKFLGRHIERRALRHYAGRVLATFASVILGLGVYDTQCGAKLFRTTEALHTVFAHPFLTTWVFDVEILARFLVLEGQGRLPDGAVACGIIEYPVEEWHDIPGSKIRLRDFFKAPLDLMRIHRYLRRSFRKE